MDDIIIENLFLEYSKGSKRLSIISKPLKGCHIIEIQYLSSSRDLFQVESGLICLVDSCTLKCFIMTNVKSTLAIKYGMRNTHYIKESQLTKISRKSRWKGNLIFTFIFCTHFLVEDFQMIFLWIICSNHFWILICNSLQILERSLFLFIKISILLYCS